MYVGLKLFGVGCTYVVAFAKLGFAAFLLFLLDYDFAIENLKFANTPT